VRAAFKAAGWTRGSAEASAQASAAGSAPASAPSSAPGSAPGWVDVQPIAPSLEDVFVLRSEAVGRAA
jgi:hypothetical protein